ncbi:EVI5-like protein isoform X3 [Hyla sarda]|uniref:EVI5-like protein isoform X3 n=1 Tax=Hyla sarda TaxID=327740 RepID=UPI0024C40E69|nr:EVI5-like protein isoform X3 [Hyla sarda]
MSTLAPLHLTDMASPALSPDDSSLSAAVSISPSDSENLSPDELELLSKLEEQNRLLEADSKSLRSVSGSCRTSVTSPGPPPLDQDSWELWGRIVTHWEEWTRRKEKLLKELIRKGIPHHFRAIVWQMLCNATDMPVKKQYADLLRMSSPCEKLIRRDIARTYPEHDFFRGQDSMGQEGLFNVMKAYSLIDREVGYCQGSAFIVGLLLMQMPEEEAFCVFVRLMQEYRLRELFKPSMAELGLCIYQLEYMLQDQLPELNLHFRSHCFHTSMYASSWFLTLFLTTFPLSIATRVFDIFIYEGLEVVFRVGMALLMVNQTELMQLDMEGMSQYFQKVIPHQFDSCPDKLIHKAYQVKYNPKRMKRLEKEYAAIKSKEMEEQIEIKRLRTENRLLKQRIETLEKESAALADRLIQGQVTRAQEAEENYAIKRELAVVKQQYYTATENLQSAQNLIRQLQDKQNDPRVKEELVSHLESELEHSRLREAETLGALKEMQEKVVELEKRNSSLPDESNVALLQEELQCLRKREAHALQVMREGQKQVTELSDRWQEVMHEKQLSRLEKECKELRDRLQNETAQYKALQSQMSEDKRRHAVSECKNKEEVMAVRLREADSMAAVAEMRQRIAELEIQKEEGMIKGKLNDSDSSQYIRELKDQIKELSQEILILRGHKPYSDSISFDGLVLSSRSGREDEDSLPSSDEELLSRPLGALQDALYPHSPHKACFLRPLRSSASSDSEEGVETNGATSDTPPEPAEEE